MDGGGIKNVEGELLSENTVKKMDAHMTKRSKRPILVICARTVAIAWEHSQVLSPPKDHDIVFNTTGRGVYFGEKEVKKEQSRLSQAINSGQIANTPVNKRLECYKIYDKLQEKSKGTMEYWKTDTEKMKETTLTAVWRISSQDFHLLQRILSSSKNSVP